MINSFFKIFGTLKKRNIFITKKSMEGCFSDNNNIGLYSTETVNDLDEAVEKYLEFNYSNLTFTQLKNDGFYLSYFKKYNPIITRRTYRFESDKEIIYRYIVTDDTGKLINQIILNKINK